MNSIFEGLADLQSSEAARTLSRQLGTDQAATQNALAAALPALLGALSRSGASPGGAESLLGALDRDHDGSILDDLLGALGGEGSGSAEEAVPGSFGIFEKLLDADGDGEIGDDVTRVGTRLIESLFRR